MRRCALASVSLLVWLAGCTRSPFACSESSQCADSGIQGTCEDTGFCSFPDDACDSGRRYGELSGSSVSGECVPTGGSTGVSSEATSGSGSAGPVGTLSDGPSTSTSETSTTPADGSTTDCVPDCEGRECGPNGCGGTCSPGCTGPDDCDAEGRCIACSPTWATPQGSGLDSLSVFDDESLLVTGEIGGNGLVAQISTCTGAPLDSVVLSTDITEFVVTAATMANGTWTIAGDVTSKKLQTEMTFHGELDFETLDADALHLLPPELEEVHTVVDPGDGTRWFGGGDFPDGMTPRPWFAYVDADSPEQRCSLSLLGDAERGTIRAGATRDGQVYLGGTYSGSAFVARFNPDACSVAACECYPEIFIPFYLTEPSGIWGMKFHGERLYAVGYRWPDGANDLAAFVVEVNLAEGSIEDEWHWNPTADDDVFRDLWFHGDTLYLVALTGSDARTQEGFGALVAMSTNLSAGPSWVASPPQISHATDVVATDDAVFITGRNDPLEQGWVMRCTADGECPD